MEATNQINQNMLLSPCRPRPADIVPAAYTIRTPFLDPEQFHLRAYSTRHNPYMYEVHHFEEGCRHCHGDHLIRYVFAAYATGKEHDRTGVIMHHDIGLGLDFHIGDYVLRVLKIELVSTEPATS